MERQKLFLLVQVEFLFGEHHGNNCHDGSLETAARQNPHPVIVALYSVIAFLTNVTACPAAGFFAALGGGPRADHEHSVFFVWNAEQRKLQFKGAFGKQQRVGRGALQQQAAEFLPVKIGVQRFAQAVIKLVQPIKGRRYPHAADVSGGGQPGQNVQ